METTMPAARVHVGTSGWAYKVWQPAFYPEKLPQTKYLQHYATRLNTVEVNYTFRHLLTEKTVTNWLQQTPENFKFVIKANQRITHIKRLKDVDDSLKAFVGSISPLERADRLGPVLFQLPPNMKAAPEVLDAFLGKLPKALRAAFEFRHESWFGDESTQVLRNHGAALCVAESDEFTTPEIHTGSFAYFRFRRSDYSKEDRDKLVARIDAAAAQGKDVFAFFKHEERPDSPLWAVEVLETAKRQK
ncbi:MAG: DUF72 domain-containing protein [Acidobacteriaceae bacterium]